MAMPTQRMQLRYTLTCMYNLLWTPTQLHYPTRMCAREWVKRKRNRPTTIQVNPPPQHNYHLQLYGLPKIHKPQVTLHPIVSSLGSATYHLAKELTRILTPLRGKTDSYIKISAHFVDKIKEIVPQDLGCHCQF